MRAKDGAIRRVQKIVAAEPRNIFIPISTATPRTGRRITADKRTKFEQQTPGGI